MFLLYIQFIIGAYFSYYDYTIYRSLTIQLLNHIINMEVRMIIPQNREIRIPVILHENSLVLFSFTNKTRLEIDIKALSAMPKELEETRKVTAVFFQVAEDIRPRNYLEYRLDVLNKYKRRGLIANPLAQIEANKINPSFAEEHPNVSEWQKDGEWYHASFSRSIAGYYQCQIRLCDRLEISLNGWWLCGIPYNE